MLSCSTRKLALSLVWIGLGLARKVRGAGTMSFGVVANGECDNMQVTWTGGTAPYHILIVPPNGVIRNISVPVDAFQNGQGSYSMPLPIAENRNYLVVMGDITGSRGMDISKMYTAGPKPAGAPNCNTTDPAPSFTFAMPANNTLNQCKGYPFTNFQNAKPPIRLIEFVPLGAATEQSVPNTDTYTFTCNIKQGHTVVFGMTDSQGQQGGVGPALTVGPGDADCLAQGGGASSTASTQPTVVTRPTKGIVLSKGQIAGIAIGCIAFVGLVGLAIFWLLRRHRKKHGYYDEKQHVRNILDSEVRHASNPPLLDPSAPPVTPFTAHSPPNSAGLQGKYREARGGADWNGADVGRYSDTRSSPTSASRGDMPNVVVHRDIADPVELPPQYSTARAPLSIPALEPTAGSSGPSSSSSWSNASPSRYSSEKSSKR